MPAPLFVLDQNFPLAVLRLTWSPILRVESLGTLAVDLTHDHEDWEVIAALDRMGGVAGFVSNDTDMLMEPATMVSLQSTKLVLVLTDRVGHEPLRATGLLMVHLEEIARRVTSSETPKPTTFVLRPGAIAQDSPGRYMNKIAEHQNRNPRELILETQALLNPGEH